ncbi:hypothetical protein C2845_PM01G13630 [Panicum miliaceum]|uniref:Uncharacterized protein n=1 Tax=Panicum miliaceum TaxID=4540 RepID=A0A3L6THM5_PANMI|nr:hypothetical protein C2845_PM01G13630 [Panicum miliaceum]
MWRPPDPPCLPPPLPPTASRRCLERKGPGWREWAGRGAWPPAEIELERGGGQIRPPPELGAPQWAGFGCRRPRPPSGCRVQARQDPPTPAALHASRRAPSSRDPARQHGRGGVGASSVGGGCWSRRGSLLGACAMPATVWRVSTARCVWGRRREASGAGVGASTVGAGARAAVGRRGRSAAGRLRHAGHGEEGELARRPRTLAWPQACAALPPAGLAAPVPPGATAAPVPGVAGGGWRQGKQGRGGARSGERRGRAERDGGERDEEVVGAAARRRIGRRWRWLASAARWEGARPPVRDAAAAMAATLRGGLGPRRGPPPARLATSPGGPPWRGPGEGEGRERGRRGWLGQRE